MAEKTLKTRIIIAILVIILVPILYNQVTNIIAGIMMQKAQNTPATVQVGTPESKEIYFSTESAGRIEAKYTVDVLARINGWLQKRYFSEGATVKAGQTLFLIEPNEYEIAVHNAQANVKQAEAAYVNAEKELKRAVELVKNDFVSKSYYDQAIATRDGNKAAFEASKAAFANAKLNLSYTKVVSPIDGKIGKIMITEGNLVNTQSGPLARIVSISPIYVYFTVKSSDFLSFKKADATDDLHDMKVEIQLADGSTYSENGKIEFVNNEVDETTGTITLRATFENADGLLVPGDFVKVTVTSATPSPVILVPQASALNDADGYYVWGIDENGKTVRKNIKVSDEIDKKWIVEEGLTTQDTYIIKGIQSVRMQGQQVKTEPYSEEAQSDDTTKTEKETK